MSIRTRTIAAVALVVVLLGVVLNVVLAQGVLRILHRQEAAEVEASLSRGDRALKLQVDQLALTAKDWGSWTDTYRFIRTQSPAYAEANLPANVLDDLDVDFMVYVDRDGNVVRDVVADDPQAGKRGTPRVDISKVVAPMTRAASRARGAAVSGVVSLPQGPALVAAHPILRSDGSGPSRGTFLLGALVGRERLQTVGAVVGHDVSLTGIGGDGSAGASRARSALAGGSDMAVAPIDSDTVAGYSVLDGVDGRPALMLSVEQPRTSFMLARQSGLYLLAAVVIGTIVLIITLIVIVDRAVLRRLERLSSDVRAVADTGDFGARIAIPGRDEVSSLGRDINGMLDALQRSEHELAFLAGHDGLTHLFNRRRFEEELGRELSEQRRLGGSGAVLWFDVDNFKDVNDSLGHAAGDALLVRFAEILRKECRTYDTLARLGGDEFAIVLPHADEAEALGAANRMIDLFREGVLEISGRMMSIGVSVGIVLYPQHGTAVEDLIANADLAMYHAKESGRGRAAFFDPAWQDDLSRRMEWAERINAALRDGRFILHAQPIKYVSDSNVCAYELLLRMIGGNGGLIPPDDFVPAAEQFGLIKDIDRWVARRTLWLLGQERAAGRDTSFSINISGRAFTDPELPDIIETGLAAYDVDPRRLIIEITETSAIADISKAQQFIDSLRRLGCRFAIDDFGSGASSFYYLKHLDVDFLKIDGSLIRALTTPSNDAYFVRAIVEMCKGLHVQTVAEYVEDAELFEAVRSVGIDLVQGFYSGCPQPLETYVPSALRARTYSSVGGGLGPVLPIRPMPRPAALWHIGDARMLAPSSGFRQDLDHGRARGLEP